MKKTVNSNTGVSAISFKPNTSYEFLFKDSMFIGVLVKTPTESKTYYLAGEGEETLTDDILKSALKAFAEMDFEGFDKIVTLFLYDKRALAQEIIKEKIEQLSSSLTAEGM